MSKLEIVKGTLFVDIDGTILHTNTEEPLPGAVEKINKAYDEGYTVIITTLRGNNYSLGSPYSIIATERTLRAIGLRYHSIMWDLPSPRIVINDDVCGHIQLKSNQSWDDIEL